MADMAGVQANGLDAGTVIQSQPVIASHSTASRGDLNLDGVSFSIADWVMTRVAWLWCNCDPAPCPPDDFCVQADLTCDGDVSVSDFYRFPPVLLGEDPPYDCPASPSSDIDSPVRHQSVAASETYVVEIRDQLLAGVDTGWIEVVLLEAPEPMTGFQFNIEYDSDRLEIVDATYGDPLEGWPLDPARYVDSVAPDRSCLRIVGSYCFFGLVCPDPPSLPDLPATLAKLKFRVCSPEEDFATNLNFAWDYCYDNGISFGTECWNCGMWPSHLAVSQNIYNASGDDITGSDDRYGGAGEYCLAGGSQDIPIREIDFHSGTLSYQQSCCVGTVGDANREGGDEPTISDISMLIDAKYIRGTCEGVVGCLAEADVNQSGGATPSCDDITIGDIAILIDYLFITGPDTATLLECLEFR
jgi:hypothetical protein